MANLRLFVLMSLLCLFNVVENESRVLQGEQSLTEIVDSDRQQMASSSPVLVKKDTVPSLARTEQETLELVDDSTHRGTNEKKTSSANVNKKYATNGGLKGQLGFLSKEETSLIDQNVNNVLKYYGLGPNVETPNTMNIKGETKKTNKGTFGQNNGSNQLFKAKKPESGRNSGTLKQGAKVSLKQVGRTLSTQPLELAARKNNKLQMQKSKMDSSQQKKIIGNNPLRGNTNVAKPFNMGRNSFDKKNSVHDGPQSSRLQPINMGRNRFDKKNSVHNGPQSRWLPIKENLKLFQDDQNQDGQTTKAALEYMRMPDKGILNLVQNEAKQAQRQTPPLGTQGTKISRSGGNIAAPVWVPVKEDTHGIQFDVNEGGMQNGMGQEQNGRPMTYEMENGMTQEQNERSMTHEMENGMTQEQNGRSVTHEMENGMGQEQNGRPMTHEMENGMGQEQNGRPMTHEMSNGMTQEQNGMPITHEMENGLENGMGQEQNGRPIIHEMENGMTQEQNGMPITHEMENGTGQKQNGRPNSTHEMQKVLSQNEKSIGNELMPFKDALPGLHHDKTQDRYIKTLTNSGKNLGMKMEMKNDSWQEMESMKPDENYNITGGANDSNNNDVIRNHTGMAGTSKTQYSETEISGNNHNKQLQSTNTSKEENEYMMEFDIEGENVQPNNNLTFKIQENSNNSFDQIRNAQENSKNSFDQIRNAQENSKNSFDQIRKEQDVTKQIWSSGKVIHSQGHESLQMTSWSPWSTCSETCGGNGLQIRTRKCTHAQKEQPACDENAVDWKWCIGVDVCPDSGLHIVNHENNSTYASVTIEGQTLPSQWGSWSSCSKRCGSQSLRVRTRKCPGQRSRTTGICVKPTMQWTWCKPNPCKGAQDARKMKTLYNNPSKPTNSIYTNDEATSPVIHTDRGLAFQDDCIVSPWSKWSKCSKSCGENSFKFRTRTCSCGYKKLCKNPSLERQHCDLKKCRGEENYGPWSAFSPCTKSCDGGWKKRTRRCKETSKGRHLCDQDLLIGVKVCNTQKCEQPSKDGMIANVNPRSMCGFNPCSEFSCMDNPDSKCLADTNCDPVFFNMFGQIDSKCGGWERYQVRNPALFCGYDPCLHSQCQRLFGRCSVDLSCKAFILGADGSVIECNKIRYPF